MIMDADPRETIFDLTCLRKGTRVWTAKSPRKRGDHSGDFSADGPQGCLTPIERIQPIQLVYSHDGRSHRIIRLLRKQFQGLMIGIRHSMAHQTLWLTPDHRVLAKLRPRSLGGHCDWSAIPAGHFQRSRELRRRATPPERKLWVALRNRQLGVKFRRQLPIGPYIADFYSREACLVVEVDDSRHFTPESQAYDARRDAFMRALGLDVLRFTARDVEANLKDVCLAIKNHCHVRMESIEGVRWIQAGALKTGDLVYFGTSKKAVPLKSIETCWVDEEVFDLEIESAHSFITDVCVVHNCGFAPPPAPRKRGVMEEARFYPPVCGGTKGGETFTGGRGGSRKTASALDNEVFFLL